MILRCFILIFIVSEIVANSSDQTKPTLDAITSVQKMIKEMRDTTLTNNIIAMKLVDNSLNNNIIQLKLLDIETKIDKLAKTVESLQTNSDCKTVNQESTEPTEEGARNETSFKCKEKPSSPVILEGKRNYVLTEVNETATAYKQAVTRNEFVTVTVNWAKQNDPCAYYNATIYLNNNTDFVWRGNVFDSSASFKLYKGGRYDIQVELCNQHGCSSNWTEVVVADTDGSHYQTGLAPSRGGFQSTSRYVIAAYYTDSNVYNNYTVRDFDSRKLTHLIYSSLVICGRSHHKSILKTCEGQEDFSVTIFDIKAAIYPYTESHDFKFDPYKGNFRDLMQRKWLNPELKVLVAIGDRSDYISLPLRQLSDEKKIHTFVGSVKEFLQTWKFFDGVDIHWYPLDDIYEEQSYLKVFEKLKVMIDQLTEEEGKQYELTAAISWDGCCLKLFTNVQQYLDKFHILTLVENLNYYSTLYAPVWKPDLMTIDKIIKSKGVDQTKIVIGAATLGRRWKHVHNNSGNLIINTKPDDIGITFDVITKGIASGAWQYYYDETAEAPFVFNNKTGFLILYEDSRSIEAKAEYVLENSLAGLLLSQLDLNSSEGQITDGKNVTINMPHYTFLMP